MAASCIAMSMTATPSLGVRPESAGVGGRGVCRLSMVSHSIVSSSLEIGSAAVGLLSLSLLSLGGRKTVRNQALAARAADLNQAVEAPPVEPSVAAVSPQGSKLYVGNLPWSVHSKQLAEIFQEFGAVELVEVIYDRDTQRSRGFAFVTMNSVGDAMKAIEKLDGTELDGRTLKVNFPQPKENTGPRVGGFRSDRPPRRENVGGERSSSYNTANKLFVGNLSWNVDDVSLDQLFSEYGKVIEAKVVFDRDSGRSRGFGFVTYATSSEVAEAISQLDGAEFDGRQLRVNLAGDKPAPRSRDY